MKNDSGIILVNVLVALALGAALVVLMFTSQDNLIDRTRRASAASQAEALALGGEASVVVALRRDMITAPDTDNFTEDWALIQQEKVQLATGAFEVQIADAQAFYDLNQLAENGLVQTQTLTLLLAQAGLPPQVGQRVIRQLQTDGPIADISQLRDLSPEVRAVLADRVTALPVKGTVNINSAPETVLAAVLGNAATAARVIALRDRQGLVTPDDLMRIGVLEGGGVGFTSDVFDVTVTAEVDGAVVTLTSRILRLHRTPQESDIRVIARHFGPKPSRIES